jgi:hypothetical protein
MDARSLLHRLEPVAAELEALRGGSRKARHHDALGQLLWRVRELQASLVDELAEHERVAHG